MDKFADAHQSNRGLVSVIIPIYKTEKYLVSSVNSVLQQSYRNIEIILVDDGSPDDCPAICDALSEKHANVRVIHKENGGLSSARNAGLDAIDSSDYVLFLDSDDQLEKDAIAGMVRKALDTGAEMVIPDRYTRVDEASGGQRIALHFPESMYTNDPKDFALSVLIGQGRAWRAHSLLYSYSLIQRSGAEFPVGHISEDISFNLQVLSAAEKIVFYPYSTVYYLKRSGSITTTFQKNFEEDIWYIDEQAQKFLERIGNTSVYGKNCVDALLCRNIVTYLFSILSKKNTSLTYAEKVKKANGLLNSPQARNVVRKKWQIPWFESKKTRWAYRTVYKLLRMHQDKAVYYLLSKV